MEKFNLKAYISSKRIHEAMDHTGGVSFDDGNEESLKDKLMGEEVTLTDVNPYDGDPVKPFITRIDGVEIENVFVWISLEDRDDISDISLTGSKLDKFLAGGPILVLGGEYEIQLTQGLEPADDLFEKLDLYANDENLNYMDGLSHIEYMKDLKMNMKYIVEEWLFEGFEKEDAIEYFTEYINNQI